jgi:hypothetical protein
MGVICLKTSVLQSAAGSRLGPSQSPASKVRQSQVERPCKMSLADILRERQRRKKAHKLGVSTHHLQNALLRKAHQPHPPPSNQAKIDFDIAKHNFNITHAPPPKPKPTHTSFPEPEEIEVRTKFDQGDVRLVKRVETPTENTFFQIASSAQVITDEQLYKEFKRNYVARGVENAFWFRRRNQRRVQPSVKREERQMNRRRWK